MNNKPMIQKGSENQNRHNVYSGYFPSKHNRLCSPRDFTDRWVAEQISAQRNAERTDLFVSHALCAVLGAMVVLAVLT
jgi:hypothetical protein